MARLSPTPVLVTGAEGFIGSAVCDALLAQAVPVRAASRYAIRDSSHPLLQPMAIGTMNYTTDWREALAPCGAVVHTAARAHVTSETADDPLSEFRRTNVEGTLALARQALDAGVKRFVFISTAKVLGEGQAMLYTDTSLPAPKDAYSISKWEAEQGLRDLTAGTRMELVILRPPLVYGPGVKANFLQLMRLVDKGYPLPFGAVVNRRSFIYLENLVQAILLCLTHPVAANSCFLLADAEPLSTPALIRAIAAALDRPARLFPLPASVIQCAAKLCGKSEMADRLLGSLMVDGSGIQRALNWSPPVSTAAGLKKTAEWFKAEFHHPNMAALRG